MIDDIILLWLDTWTVRGFVIGWLTTSLVAYLLTRRSYRIRELSWDRADALIMVFLCVAVGPLIMFFAAIFNLHSKLFFDWLDKPSRW